MAALPRLQQLAVPTPNTGLDQQSALMFNQGLSALANAVRGYGVDVKNDNTQSLIAQAAGVGSLDQLPGQREAILAGIANYGKAVDGSKVLEALNRQENQLYNTQNNINQLDQYKRNVQNEQNRQNDLKLLGNPELIQAAMKGDKSALDHISQFTDPTRLIDMYSTGVRNEQQLAQYNQSRQDRLTQQNFENNLSTESRNLSLAQALNPNPGETTTRLTRDANGNLVETTQTSPSLASTLATVANNRNSSGLLNWGNTGGSYNTPKPVQSAVSANLNSLSKNLGGANPELAAVVNKLNIRDPHVLAMMAIESGGGGMSTSSGSSIGPMQLNKKYAQADAKKYGIAGNPLTDMEANVRTGIAKMQDLSAKFNGNPEAIAIGYNGGENAARVAYNAWNAAGQKGNVADYIPASYKSKGNDISYDVNQMRTHAQKFQSAVGFLSSSNGKSNSTKATQSSAPTGFAIDSSILANAKKSFEGEVKKNQFGVNAAGRSANNVVNKNGLQMFLQDNKIEQGKEWGTFLNDSQKVYNNLTKNPAFNELSPLDQKDVLSKAIKFNKENQGWLGINPTDKTKERAALEMQNLIETKKQGYMEKNFTALRAEAQKAIDAAAKSKKSKGPLPDLDTVMEYINPEMYNTLKSQNKKVNNPF